MLPERPLSICCPAIKFPFLYRKINIMEKKTLLLVDDDPSFLHGIRRALHQQPYRIVTAGSSQEAIAVLKEMKIQVVVSDYKMPQMNGLHLLNYIKKSNPNIILIMLTGYADVGVLLDAINEVGLFKFLVKPVKLEFFKQAIVSAMDLVVESREAGLASHSESIRKMLLSELEQHYPGITSLPPRDKEGYYIISPE